MRFQSKSKIDAFGEVFHPSEAVEPILAGPVRASLMEWLTEIWAEDELREVSLAPRKRAMFHGAPGTGKTTLAHHLSARLGLPMVAVRPDRVVDCWLGSTGRNLGQLFDAARPMPDGDGPVVLFFDEFDAIAQRRVSGARDAQREMNSVVDTLLQRIEAHAGFIIAATNHADHLDPAVWRRFDLQISLETPGQFERERILARYLRPFGLAPDALSALAMACETASPSLLRQFCEGLKRNLVVGEKIGWDMRRDAVIARVLASIEPHPDLGKPRLWALGIDDAAVQRMPWPLPDAAAVQAMPDTAPEAPPDTVVALRPAGRVS
ncbi:MAG: ATP-binding protein [Rhodobacter sp.]|nr:ATP-binding protein [Rhodobacter sp.]